MVPVLWILGDETGPMVMKPVLWNKILFLDRVSGFAVHRTENKAFRELRSHEICYETGMLFLFLIFLTTFIIFDQELLHDRRSAWQGAFPRHGTFAS
jgi:hypothetical protein